MGVWRVFLELPPSLIIAGCFEVGVGIQRELASAADLIGWSVSRFFPLIVSWLLQVCLLSPLQGLSTWRTLSIRPIADTFVYIVAPRHTHRSLHSLPSYTTEPSPFAFPSSQLCRAFCFCREFHCSVLERLFTQSSLRLPSGITFAKGNRDAEIVT